MKFKQHFKKKELSYFNLVLLEAKNLIEDEGEGEVTFSSKMMERKKYDNKKSRVGYQYYKPISKILSFENE